MISFVFAAAMTMTCGPEKAAVALAQSDFDQARAEQVAAKVEERGALAGLVATRGELLQARLIAHRACEQANLDASWAKAQRVAKAASR